MYIAVLYVLYFFFFSSRRRHTRYIGDWSSDVCSSDLTSLYHLESWTRIARLGATIDDAVGEAYDKVAAILGLGRSEERRVGKECRSRWRAYGWKEMIRYCLL